MINLFRHFLRLIGLNRWVKPSDAQLILSSDSYEDLDLSENLSLESIDIILAINEDSVIPAKNLATQKNSLSIVDLSCLPNPRKLDNARFNAALSSSDLVFSANRELATKLEETLNRHIIISRHTTYFEPHQKYIDLKKVYHLIDDTQLVIFNAIHSQNLAGDLAFLASLLSDIPRHIHFIVTGGQAENKIFGQQSSVFGQFNCTSRMHFYVENLEAIKYPIDYASIDIALILGENHAQTPTQYYKYLHEEVAIFATNFADSNQLITSPEIGQIFDGYNIEAWKIAINTFLNLSQTKRDETVEKLRLQKQHINWQSETDHYISSTLNMLETNDTDPLQAVIVDLSKQKISDRTHNLGYMLIEQGINVSIIAPFLPMIHPPFASNIEYIKVS